MDPTDRELMDQLAKGPFECDGFDQRLRQRIVDRVGKQAGLSRLRRTAAWQWPLAALASCAVVIIAAWLWNYYSVPEQPLDKALAVHTDNIRTSASPVASASVDPSKKYALLIGLRKDDTTQPIPVSEYRTLLIADERQPEQLQLMADMPGLYMPYGQNFWQIVDIASSDHRHALQAVQVTGRKSDQKEPPGHVPDYVLSERVSYAGNEYLSIQSTVKAADGGTADNRWIKHIGQMNEKPDDPQAEPHTLLGDVAPENIINQGTNHQWSIYRNSGHWVSELYNPVSGDRYPLHDLPQSVIQNDTLLMNWADIQKVEPAVKDAFTYGNVLGVVTDQEIVVRSMKNNVAVSTPVHVPLSGGESVIMIQWAQNDKIDYVDKWIQDFQGLAKR